MLGGAAALNAAVPAVTAVFFRARDTSLVLGRATSPVATARRSPTVVVRFGDALALACALLHVAAAPVVGTTRSVSTGIDLGDLHRRDHRRRDGRRRGGRLRVGGVLTVARRHGQRRQQQRRPQKPFCAGPSLHDRPCLDRKTREFKGPASVGLHFRAVPHRLDQRRVRSPSPSSPVRRPARGRLRILERIRSFARPKLEPTPPRLRHARGGCGDHRELCRGDGRSQR